MTVIFLLLGGNRRNGSCFMDICLIEIEDNIRISPQSIEGMLWLQTHFKKEHWNAIASNEASIPKKDTPELFEDAKEAGLKLNFLQNLCIAEKF